LDGPISSARTHNWTKYGGSRTTESHRGSPSDLEVEADDVTIVEHEDDTASKYTTRGTAAHGVRLPDTGRPTQPISFVKEWIVTRTIEGRTYRRSDEFMIVELKD
jgi:hypothetical protein